jgi:hypothetical protein
VYTIIKADEALTSVIPPLIASPAYKYLLTSQLQASFTPNNPYPDATMFAFANTNNIDISSGGCRSTANGIYPLFGKPIITSIQPTRYDEKGRQVHYIESAVQRRERLAFLKKRELDRVATTTSTVYLALPFVTQHFV